MAYKVGDKVRVVRKITDVPGWDMLWVSAMDLLVGDGKVYTISSMDESTGYMVDGWWFPHAALELVDYTPACMHVKPIVGEGIHKDRIPGAKKFDDDKPRMDLVLFGVPHALESVGAVLTHGYKKYGGEHGWKELPNAKKRYWAALIRHMLKLAQGEYIDADSGLPHLSHIAANAMFLCELYITKGEMIHAQ